MTLANALPVIFSCSGLTLSEEERDFFRESNPLGFILFGRNIDNPQQLRALTDELRACVGRDCPILIDQEGGRVERLKSPHWTETPPMRQFGKKAESDIEGAKADLRHAILRQCDDLKAAGITVNCAPVADLIIEGQHEIIGDRSFGSDPSLVAELCQSVCDTFLSAGITPIIKHIPGHGRALADSHKELPVVDAALYELIKDDFMAFKLKSQQGVWAMTAHILYKYLDPNLPATLSSHIIHNVIRGTIGFEGVLIGDDLDMLALEPYGTISDRAVASLEAGCDLALYCWADMDVMRSLADTLPKMSADTLKRLQ